MADEKFTKADIDAAVKAATDKVQESIDKLEAKNAELVGDLRKARKAGEIKPEDLTAAEERADKAEAKLKELEGSVKTLTKERDTAVKSLTDEQGVTHRLIAENGLVAELTKLGVTDPDYLDMAKSKHLPNVKVVAEGAERKALYGDKPLADALKEWAATDAGKKVIAAPANSGGGAPGGQKGAPAKTMTRDQFNALDQMGKAEAGAASAKGELQIVDTPA